MSTFLRSLTAVAVVGTSRPAPSLPSLPGESGRSLAALGETAADAAARLLRQAGAAAVFEHCGHVPPQAGAAAAGAGTETLVALERPGALTALTDILADGPERMQCLALAALDRRGRLLPPLLLPRALELGRRNTRLREALRPVLGVRGTWLATRNPEWRWALALPDEGADFEWETATPEQRLAWLEREWGPRPERARQRLQEGFAGLPARERLQLLDSLRPRVAPEDEEFLTRLLEDRSKEVRQTAALLLSAVPGSRLGRTIAAALAPALQAQRKLLRQTLAFEPPEAFDPAWKAFTLEDDKPQYESLGQRAWWTFQLVRLAPLAWWREHTGRAPADLLAWAADSDWAQPLLRGWLAALEWQADPDWADAWLRFEAPGRLQVDRGQLLRMLPPTQRPEHWRQLLSQCKPERGPGAALRLLLDGLPPGQLLDDTPLARRVLDSLRHCTLEKDYELRAILPELAGVLPDDILDEACSLELRDVLARCASQDSAARFGLLVEHRLSLHSALQDETP